MLVVCLSSTLIACGDSEDEPAMPGQSSVTVQTTTSDSKKETNYYVMYEMVSQSSVGGASLKTTLNYVTEKGEQTVTTNKTSWTGSYGPLKEGDKVSFKVETNSPYQHLARIYVCKNNEPFVIKAEKYFTSKASLIYTIDF